MWRRGRRDEGVLVEQLQQGGAAAPDVVARHDEETGGCRSRRGGQRQRGYVQVR